MYDSCNSIFVISCYDLNLTQLLDLLKSKDNYNKRFIKNNQIDILKTNFFNQIEEYINTHTHNIVKSFGMGGVLYNNQISGSSCPRTNKGANFEKCRNCTSLIKKEILPTRFVACGEHIPVNQSLVSAIDSFLIEYYPIRISLGCNNHNGNPKYIFHIF